jgi:hypothetical protein
MGLLLLSRLLRVVSVAAVVIDVQDPSDGAPDLQELLGARMSGGVKVQLEAGREAEASPEFRGELGPSRRGKRQGCRGDIFGHGGHVLPGEDFADRVERMTRRLKLLNPPQCLDVPLVIMPPPSQP